MEVLRADGFPRGAPGGSRRRLRTPTSRVTCVPGGPRFRTFLGFPVLGRLLPDRFLSSFSTEPRPPFYDYVSGNSLVLQKAIAFFGGLFMLIYVDLGSIRRAAWALRRCLFQGLFWTPFRKRLGPVSGPFRSSFGSLFDIESGARSGTSRKRSQTRSARAR